MNSEVFRFVTVRPAQELDGPADATIDLGLGTTPFADTLRALGSKGDRAGMVGAATAFVASAGFLDSPRRIDQAYLDLLAAVRALSEPEFWAGAGRAFTDIFRAAPAEIVKSETFASFYGRTSDSIVAAAMDRSVPPKVRALLTASARVQWLIRRLSSGRPLSRSRYAKAPFVLPAGIFPLPVAGGDLRHQGKAAAEADRARLDARRRRLTTLTADLAAHRRAAEEVLTTFGRTGAGPVARTTVAPPAVAGFALPADAAAGLTGPTKRVLGALGLDGAPIDVARTIVLLEGRTADLANELYADTGAVRHLVRIGDTFVPDLLGGPAGTLDVDPAAPRTPGACPPVAAGPIPEDTVTVPTGHGDARVLGIADLMILEQELLRYQLGEIAHIENVLRSETRSRMFKTSTTTEASQTTETETTQDKEQDLSSAERFELQSQSQTVIAENASRDSGLTIHASYGPSVDATSNVNYTSGSSRQQSNSTSSTYAREITTKAVNRVQTRMLTRRTASTVNVVEEVNRHGFDNTAGDADIVGVYRFLDKVYRAQVVNYGKRLMLEFVVPEPAAFLRYALTHRPLDDVHPVEPDRPGYCLGDGASFVALQAADLTRDNYLYWAGRYGAQDVTSPPPSVILAAGAKKAPDSMPTAGTRLICSDLLDVPIADGYLAQSAFVNIYGETQAGKHQIVYQVQEQQGVYIEPEDDGQLFPLQLQPTPVVTVTINAVGFHNYEVLALVFCTLSAERFQDWQFKTFTAIMSAYEDEKSRYDQAVSEARLQARDDVVGGTNPANNRETEQTELKKACISLLTGQRFDLFDAVGRNVAPFGYPELDFAEAKAEGAYIQVFEQSFEWNNMTYLFYPYFWGRKDEWPTVAQLSDADPLFARFLRAGAGRVQVPVRLGFEEGMLTYLSTGELWAGDGTLVTSDGDAPDPLHLSILDELRSQSGDNSVAGVGTVSVTHGGTDVTGDGTAFGADDERRRIQIAGETHVIRAVVDERTVELATPFAGDSAAGVGYSMGGRLIGEPWEVRLPTDLIKLDNSLVIG